MIRLVCHCSVSSVRDASDSALTLRASKFKTDKNFPGTAEDLKDAGIDLPCDNSYTKTPACRFHEFRRELAALNADRMSGDALKVPMRHQCYLTTQGYINMANQINQAAADVYVPDVLKEIAD